MMDSPIAKEEAQQMKMVTYAGNERYQGRINHHLQVFFLGEILFRDISS